MVGENITMFLIALPAFIGLVLDIVLEEFFTIPEGIFFFPGLAISLIFLFLIKDDTPTKPTKRKTSSN